MKKYTEQYLRKLIKEELSENYEQENEFPEWNPFRDKNKVKTEAAGQDDNTVALNNVNYKSKSYKTTNSKYVKGFRIEPRINSEAFNDSLDKAKGVSKDVSNQILNSLQPDSYHVYFDGGLSVSILDFQESLNEKKFETEDEAKKAALELVKAWEQFLKKYYRK